ncbi:DinB family protein [Algoriphagus marinus]|uniref:DinB family protein n=1 Tax=Algoriphagus marinus TaxID=1925762 RepID=UPI00094B8D33|nr:DinB family protein [Algoriphagus marinus]
MKNQLKPTNRRAFLKQGIAVSAGIAGISQIAKAASTNPDFASEDLMFIGPRKGYSPQIGALVSMMAYMRQTIIDTVKNLSVEDLDYLFDENANSIGAMIMHLGATDKFYQINTFEGREEFTAEEDEIWGAAMRLGAEGREKIKGNTAAYYLKMIGEVRAETLEKLKEKDDKWLMEVDKGWSSPGNEVNTYWKWFHVMEHESNHGGQMRIIRDRAPSKF